MQNSDYILIIIFGYISEIAGTIAGFGSSSIFLPLVSQILDFKNALILVAIYHIFGNSSRLLMFYKYFNTKIFLLFGIPSIFSTLIGAYLSSMIDQNILKLLLGIILILFALYSLIHPNIQIKKQALYGIIGGGLSGFSAGLIGTGGVLRGAFMSIFQLPKEQYIATIAAVALIVDFTRIPVYFGGGFLDIKHLILIPILFFIAIFGSYTGKQIVKILPEHLFRKIILIGVIILSGIMILGAFSKL